MAPQSVSLYSQDICVHIGNGVRTVLPRRRSQFDWVFWAKCFCEYFGMRQSDFYRYGKMNLVQIGVSGGGLCCAIIVLRPY